MIPVGLVNTTEFSSSHRLQTQEDPPSLIQSLCVLILKMIPITFMIFFLCRYLLNTKRRVKRDPHTHKPWQRAIGACMIN